MKKLSLLALSCAMLLSLVACGGSDEGSANSTSEIYTATASGFGGDVNVTISVEEGTIVSVTAEGENETQGIGSPALEQLPADILDAKSTSVDVVAGATVTSEAIIEATNSAVAQSGASF